ncbi:hypothetical protein CI109_104904 [Kwoniella shandongensis]|uniref:Uncharacterized protein n=1 Tax=Kwoniella shandongensis TaxID=1734106 RepID=A0A5M6BSF2_9TREE|nr:uncharacterized protein CI109_006622 [Kwoniella shandongensis]KAA5525071.1 hypothetical protein CI109_006622 [Kwoniella shandongensis]
MSDTQQNKPLTAFVSFPSPYTQSLIVQALVSTLPALNLSLAPFPEDQPPALQWADYDLLSFDLPHSNPTEYLISSYIYRKALIRKHQLHSTITSYLAKCQHRGVKSVLADGGVPKGWTVDIQFADELDEILMDDLYELADGMRENEDKEERDRRWWILKPGFADRAQGIRMFSTEDELRAVFEEFEPPSSDEEDEDEEEDVDENEDEDNEGNVTSLKDTVDDSLQALAKKAAEMGFGDDDKPGPDENDEDEDGTGVMTSQLRHFVIQEYMPRPVLFDIAQVANEPSSHPLTGYKFHLRSYVLLTGGYTVHVARTMLALFSGSPFVPPIADDGEMDLRPHLTNTCLQTDAYGAPTPPEELVKLFWELEGLSGLAESSSGKYEERGVVTKQWLEEVFGKVGDVVAESIKAGAECGSFGLQLMPNAFEIFGVDLLLSFPPPSSTDSSSMLPIPTVTLLEFNASPDFHQSGNRLRPQLLEMFKGVIRISVAPFFKLETNGEKSASTEEDEWELGAERWGWRLAGKGEVRGSGW